MNDVRQAAEERASRPKGSPVGASFESERQLDALDGRNVRKIAAAAETPEEDRVLRVAAYCRVSTDDIDQKLSIHLQIQQYMKKIKENPNWKYAGCYVDDGFSGTNTDHRQGFQKLMKDAMDGKIDMIIKFTISAADFQSGRKVVSPFSLPPEFPICLFPSNLRQRKKREASHTKCAKPPAKALSSRFNKMQFLIADPHFRKVLVRHCEVVVLKALEGVAVGVHGDLDVGMSEYVLEHLCLHTRLDTPCCEGVPERVE